jgi:RNA polymerase sigma-70 factor (ECF subfamily)
MPEATVGVMPPDELLVGLARGGDRPALEELFRRHSGVAYRVAYRFLGHEQDALDAVQDGLI